MHMKKQLNNADVIDSCTARLNALKQYISNTKVTIKVNGEAHKVSDLIAIYQRCLDTRAALNTQRAQVKETMTSRANAEAQRRAADLALKPWVINEYGATSTAAHDFGFPPRKAPALTAEEKAAAVALGQATRAARHTMGSKQKKGIKGTIVAPTAPAAPATNEASVAQAPVVSTPATPATPVNGAAVATANGAAAS
jgi:hypothetical protein